MQEQIQMTTDINTKLTNLLLSWLKQHRQWIKYKRVTFDTVE